MLPAMGSKSLQFQLRGISCRMGPSVGRWGLEVVSYVASDLLEVHCFNNNKKKNPKKSVDKDTFCSGRIFHHVSVYDIWAI